MHGQPQHACAEPPPSALNMTLPTFAADRRRPSYLLPAERSAANPPAAVTAVDRRDRQTDGHATVT